MFNNKTTEEPKIDRRLEEKRALAEKRKKVRKIVQISAAVLIGISFLLNIIFVPMAFSGKGKIEGGGKNSAKSAATAYVKAFKKGDIDKMLSLTAVESYLDNLSFEEKLLADGNFNFSGYIFPYDTDTIQTEMSVEMYRSHLVREIQNKYLYLDSKLSPTGNGYKVDSYTVSEKVVNTLVNNDFKKKLKKMKIGKAIVASEINEIVSEDITEQGEKVAKYLKCDDFASYVVPITLSDKEYYMFIDLVCLNGKWYVLTTSSNIALLAGADSTSFIKAR